MKIIRHERHYRLIRVVILFRAAILFLRDDVMAWNLFHHYWLIVGGINPLLHEIKVSTAVRDKYWLTVWNFPGYTDEWQNLTKSHVTDI